MNNEGFVEAIKLIASSALSGLLKTIENPPGRSPSPNLVHISDFFHSLNEKDRQTFADSLELAARQSIGNLFLVLDGSLAIESTTDKGQLELYYNNGKERVRLNDPCEVPLNEIYRREV